MSISGDGDIYGLLNRDVADGQDYAPEHIQPITGQADNELILKQREQPSNADTNALQKIMFYDSAASNPGKGDALKEVQDRAAKDIKEALSSKESYDSTAPKVATALQAALNKGVPLTALVDSIKNQVGERSFGEPPVKLDLYKDKTMGRISFSPMGIGGFQLDVKQNTNKSWSVKDNGMRLR